MRRFGTLAGAVLFACNVAGFSQSTVVCGEVLDGALRPGGELTIHSIPAGIAIVAGNDVASEKGGLRVMCSAEDREGAKQVRLRLSGDAGHSQLTVEGPHLRHGNLQIHVEVPRKTNLKVTMSAGEVKVDEIRGDKDVTVTAGHIAISSARAWDYREVDASVGIGAVSVPAHGAEKGGFFPSFRRENRDGEYRLHAHVTTGKIDLLGDDAPSSTASH